MGKIYRITVLTMVMMLLSGCTLAVHMKKDPLPEETIEIFEDAINEMDVETMMECMDPKAVKAMTAGMDVIMGLASGLTGFDIPISAEDLIAMMPMMQGITAAYGAEMEVPQVDLQVTETYIKGDKATVFFTEAGSGENAAINMELQDGKWLMTMDLKPIMPEDAERVIIAGQEEAEETQNDSGTLEIAGSLKLDEALESFSVLDLFSQEKIEGLLRSFLSPDAE